MLLSRAGHLFDGTFYRFSDSERNSSFLPITFFLQCFLHPPPSPNSIIILFKFSPRSVSPGTGKKIHTTGMSALPPRRERQYDVIYRCSIVSSSGGTTWKLLFESSCQILKHTFLRLHLKKTFSIFR